MLPQIQLLGNPFVAGIFSGVLLCIFVFVDSWQNETEMALSDYFKLFASVSAVVVAIIYINRAVAGTRGGWSGGAAAISSASSYAMDCSPADF